MRPARSRTEFLSASIGSLDGYWLRITCTPPCGYSSDYPLRLLARERRGDMRVADVLPRLRCKACGGRPSEALITDDPAGGGHGGPGKAWTVRLVP